VRLFLDANVLLAAPHSPAGRSRALFTLAERGLCTLVTSPHAIEEARRNVNLKSPSGASSLDDLLESVERVSEADPRLVAWAADQGLPPGDAPILAAAVAAAADALVTGDRTHFGHLFGTRVGDVEVLSLAEAIGRLIAG
jgi:predicted nucleic acid-binding protein